MSIDFDIFLETLRMWPFHDKCHREDKNSISLLSKVRWFWISITIFACLVFFFNAYYLFDVGQNFWAFTDDVRRGSRKVVLCLSCLHSRDDRTTSSEISLLPWNFPLPELDPKSRLLMNLQYVSWKSFWKVKWNTTLWVVLAENFREERNIPSLGPGSLGGGGGGGGEGREKTGTNRINIGEQSDPSGCLESAYFARQFFSLFPPMQSLVPG